MSVQRIGGGSIDGPILGAVAIERYADGDTIAFGGPGTPGELITGRDVFYAPPEGWDAITIGQTTALFPVVRVWRSPLAHTDKPGPRSAASLPLGTDGITPKIPQLSVIGGIDPLGQIARRALSLPNGALRVSVSQAAPSDVTEVLAGGGVAALNDTLTVAVSGQETATLQVTINSITGNPVLAAEYSNDGTNWLPAPFAKRLNVVAANPTVAPFSSLSVGGAGGLTLVVNDVWEIPLPGNCMFFRLRNTVAAQGATLAISRGSYYTPGVPVVATLMDTTVAFGVALNSGVIDASGWSLVMAHFLNNDTGGVNRSFFLQSVLDDGTPVSINGGSLQAIASGGFFTTALGPAPTSGEGILPRRINAQAQAGTGTGGSSRIVLQARR